MKKFLYTTGIILLALGGLFLLSGYRLAKSNKNGNNLITENKKNGNKNRKNSPLE